MSDLRERLARVPPFTLGFVLLALVQAGTDLVDPTAGTVEEQLSLFVLAFAAAGFVVAVAMGPGRERPFGPAAALVLRASLLGTGVLVLALVVAGARLNPLVDALFVLGLLLLAAVTLPLPASPGPAARLVDRAAVPAGMVTVLVGLPVAATKLATLV